MPNVIISLRSMQVVLERTVDLRISAISEQANALGIATVERDGALYVVHPEDDVNSVRIVILDDRRLASMSAGYLRNALERVHRVALEALHPPVTLPWGWGSFTHDNLLAFYAGPQSSGDLRWIAEVNPLGSRDVCFWRLYKSSEPVYLDAFVPDYARYSASVAAWGDVLSELTERLAALLDEQKPSIESAVDLDVTTFGAVVGHRTYTSWLSELSPRQNEFVVASTNQPIKLRGAAGTGKTLALELKALRELYALRELGTEPRVLFATHSWAMAEQVDAALRALDETGGIDGLDVYPLLTIATETLPAERGGFGYELLGEDSLTGKQEQFALIGRLLEDFHRGDWLALRDRTSWSILERVEAGVDTAKRNSLIWDLMVEFTTVLSANGILPGVNARRQYLAVSRTPWMMPLATEGDKLFTLRIYTDYVESLRARRVLTSDQLVNDFLNYLETFAWNIRRESEGYDLIFVDELHLFGEQERLALHYLTRSPNEYPRMFMALDPRQSPAELYANVGDEAIVRGESGMADAFLGKLRSVELSAVHRFTPEILALVRHINNSYPALGLGEDWELDLSDVSTSVESGAKPVIFEHADNAIESQAVLARASQLLSERPRGARTAILLLEPFSLANFRETFPGDWPGNVTVIASRDDVAELQYRRRGIVLSAAEYVGGLQFDSIIIGGLGSGPAGFANLCHQRRRFLALLYLGITRATRHVEIHVNDADGGIPDVLSSALSGGSLTRGEAL